MFDYYPTSPCYGGIMFYLCHYIFLTFLNDQKMNYIMLYLDSMSLVTAVTKLNCFAHPTKTSESLPRYSYITNVIRSRLYIGCTRWHFHAKYATPFYCYANM